MSKQASVTLFFICILSLHAAAAANVEPKTLQRTVDGLVIPGQLIPELVGQKIERIIVFAEKDGALTVIPFQVDEMTPEGNEYILAQGPKPNIDKSDGVLSRQDEIALMAKDLGGRVDRGAWPAGAEKTVEVEVIDPLDGTRAWCYVSAVPSPPQLSKIDYVQWLPDKGEMRSAVCINGYPPARNAIYFTKVVGVPPRGGNGEDFVDRMKLRFRFESRLGLLSFSGNEDQAGQQVLREKDGQVRVFRKGVVYYELPFGIQYNAGGTLQIYWESFGQGPVELKMIPGVRAILRRAMMIATTDFAPAAKGMRFFSDKDPEGVIIDGMMSDKEKHLELTGLKWSCATGDPGTLCQRTPTNVPQLPREDAYLEWVDDETRPDPPEEFPGMLGCLMNYFDLSALPAGLWRSAGIFYAPPANIKYEDVQQYLNIDMHPLVIKVGDRMGRSHILPWHPELPADYYTNYQPLAGEVNLR